MGEAAKASVKMECFYYVSMILAASDQSSLKLNRQRSKDIREIVATFKAYTLSQLVYKYL